LATRILVTGANGFVGRHLVALLRAAEPEAEVYTWHRSSMRPPDSSSRNATEATSSRVVDVLDRKSVRSWLAEACPAEVYHLAGIAHVGQSWTDAATTFDVNVTGTHLLLDEMRRGGIDARVVIPGSATIYAPTEDVLTEAGAIRPASPYALSKLAQEMLALRAFGDDGQRAVVARAFNHFGPGQDPSFFAPSFARQLAEIELGRISPTLRVGNLDARRDLTDVRDTVRAYRALMKQGEPGRVYNVCSGRAWQIGEVLEALLVRCRVKVGLKVDPALLRPNDVPVMVGSYERLRQETGWRPQIPLEQTVTDILEEARERLARQASDVTAARSS
jgi:GDP-4-dehydro-6-deoxy-D-mannose reductase